MTSATVYLHSSEQMIEVADKSAKLLIGASVFLGKDATWEDYAALYRRVYIDEGLRVLRPLDGVLLVIQTDAYHDGTVMPKNARLPLMLMEAGYRLLDEKVWQRRTSDFFQVPFSMVFVFAVPGSKITRKAFDSHPGYFKGVWDYKQPKGGALNAYPDELCSMITEVFTATDDLIVDPFAGTGRLLGVAARMGREAIGYDIDPEVVQYLEANLKGVGKVVVPGTTGDTRASSVDGVAPAGADEEDGEAEDYTPEPVAQPEAAAMLAIDPASKLPVPTWICGDSTKLDELIPEDQKYDLCWSCPPYADLEVYSDDPRDLSNMPYEQFIEMYRTIIRKAVARLRDDRFAVFVIGDIRDPKGIYRNFVSHTIAAFQDAGAMLYNEGIFVTQIGSLAVRVGRQFELGRKFGKALRNGTPVLTPLGWVAVEDLHQGDLVIAGDGTPTEVTGVFPQGERPMLTVRFNDGSEVDVDPEHLWAIETREMDRTVMTTQQILDRWGEHPHDPRPMIPTVGLVQLPRQDVPIDPYLIGLLLGDGGLSGTTPILSTADEEIVDLLPTLVPEGVEVKSRGYDYRLVGVGSRSSKNPLTLKLRALGMMEKLAAAKAVPALYRWNDAEVRLAVLRGLMDSDGSVTNDRAATTEFGTNSPQLAVDVQFLARSLGMHAWIKARRTASGKMGYRVWLRGGPCPFRLDRKARIWKEADANRTRRKERRIISITPAAAGEATCIAVAHPDKLFVTQHFIVTHNTHQNYLVFVKGDAKRAVAEMGPVEFGAIVAAAADDEDDPMESGYVDDPEIAAEAVVVPQEPPEPEDPISGTVGSAGAWHNTPVAPGLDAPDGEA